MLNQIITVGRLTNIKKEELENGGKKVIATLAVPQYFKNADGEYDTNFIDFTLYGGIAENTVEYCKKGDIIGVRGRIQRIDTNKPIELIAEKITFLSSKRKDEEEA